MTPRSTLRRRLYLYSLFDEIGPIYAVYPLWFADHGLSVADISILYVVWAAIVLLLEIPSGALADRVDRRHLVAVALFLRALGVGAWLVVPSFWGFCCGAALFATHEAMCSGSFEALVYDELKAINRESDYAVVTARMGQFQYVGIGVATAAAASLLWLAVDVSCLGWFTVGLHAIPFAMVASLPRSRRVETEGLSLSAWWATLRQGTRLVLRHGGIARLVVLGCLLEGLFILDEYVHLLGKHRGASDATVPLLVGGLWVGLLAGGELAARRPGLSSRVLAGLLGLGVVLGGIGLITNTVWGVLSIGLTYAALNACWVRADARLQARLVDATRATATSVRSLMSALVSLAALGVVGLVAQDNDPTLGILLLLGPLLLAAVLVQAWA